MPTRLEKTLYRLEAQCICLAWVFDQIAARPGPVFELGLGLGRTYNHMRHYLKGRDIHVFEREVRCYPDCTPDDEFLIVGDLAQTLPAAAKRFAGQVLLAHSDVGSFEPAHNDHMSGLVSKGISGALAPGGFVLSDLPLNIAGTMRLDLPEGARVDRYYMYRFEG